MVQRDVAPDVTVAADDGVADLGVAADAAVRPDNGAVHDRVFLDLRLPSDHRIRADSSARLDRHAVVNEAGALDGRTVFDAGIGRHGRARAGHVAERVGDIAPVHDAAVDL